MKACQTRRVTRIALTIAGSDPSGGAGLQADLKTFHRFGVYGEAVVTLVTVQNTHGVTRVDVLAHDLVLEQIHAVCSDIPPHAGKIGALGNSAVVEAIAAAAQSFAFPLVIDPVMISKHGARLMDGEGQRAIAACLIPRAFLLTPNLEEATVLVGFPVTDITSMRKAAEKLASLGAKNVLIKGGHLNSGDAVDVLFEPEHGFHEFSSPRASSPNIPTGRDAPTPPRSPRNWQKVPHSAMLSAMPRSSLPRRFERRRAWDRELAR